MARKLLASRFGLVAIAAFAFVLGVALSVSVPSAAQQDSRHMLLLQGRLTDEGGALVTGERSFRLRVFNADTAGTVVFDETHSTVNVNNGIYSILVGSGDITLGASIPGQGGVAESIFELNDDLWLQITVNGSDLSPRTKLVSSGFSYHALMADGATGSGDQGAELPSYGCYVHWGWDRNTNDNDGNERCGEGYYPVYTGYGMMFASAGHHGSTDNWCHNKDNYPNASSGDNGWNPSISYFNNWGNWAAHGSQSHIRLGCVVCCATQ